MIEVILLSVAVVSLTALMAVIKVHKNECNLCYFKCENCKEKNVCGINKQKQEE